MPIYEYQCHDCDQRVEVLQKLSEAPKIDCPQCGEPSLRKKVSAVAFRLKGSGWYETDFKTGNKKNLAGDSAANTDSGAASASSEKTATTEKPGSSKTDSSKAEKSSTKTASGTGTSGQSKTA